MANKFITIDRLDPGQVPNGAKCAENKMCVNAKCVSVQAPANCGSCNAPGSKCDQFGVCHSSLGNEETGKQLPSNVS